MCTDVCIIPIAVTYILQLEKTGAEERGKQ